MCRLSSELIRRIAFGSMMVLLFVKVLPAQTSPHGPLKNPCSDCHSTQSWKELTLPMKFNHSSTGFALQGMHVNVPCIQCHTTKRFAGTPSECYACHRDDFAKALIPNHQLGKFSHDCLTCHTANVWKPSIFQHAKTNFQLSGAHLSVDCASCHTNNRFAGLSSECFSCHQKDYLQTKSPDHAAAQFSRDCLTCHTMNGWTPSTFNHSKTDFTLVGAHVTMECSSCHKNGRFRGTPVDCYSCHQGQYVKAVNPNHAAAQFNHDCSACHTSVNWNPSTFNHGKTNFQLLGAHKTAECSSCHTNGQFKGLPTDCYPCHQTQFAKTISPNHVTGQFSQLCLDCHTLTAWKPSTFDHSKTNFILTGAHVAEDCQSCHMNGQFKGVATDCYSCHQTDFNKTTTPNHVLGQFSHDCISCHTTTVWKPSTFNHSTTNFPLTGAHVAQSCESCHKNGQFKGTASDCYTCHQNDFNATTTPNHLLAQFLHDCLSCHTTTLWKPSTFNHSATNFPLTGAHVSTDCLFCHKNGQFTGTASDCYSCHQTDYANVTDPNHVSGNFDHNCSTCHTTSAWSPATFDHNKTNFTLTGAHVSVECNRCHTGGKYTGTSTDCYACHQQDYNSSVNPAHATAHYPTTCITCHTTTSWSPSTFDHTPFFPISSGSKHRPGRWTTCQDCHTNSSNFSVFSCITCHEHNKTSMDDKHKNRAGYVYESSACYRCHPRGEGD
jgi:hypothetical protein